LFKRLARATCPERIADEIKQLIIDQKLEPGGRLPAERELAEQFGVSRASVREAVKGLVAVGVLEAHTGNGTFVRADLNDSVLGSLSWAVLLAGRVEPEVTEVRALIEPTIAALAAERATESDRKKLQETIVAMKAALGQPSLVVEADLAFHMALAQAAHNRILQEVMNGLQRLLRGNIAGHVLEIENQQSCLRNHISVYRAIEARDPVMAREAMIQNLQDDMLPASEVEG